MELLLRRAFCFRGELLAQGAPVCPVVHDDMATAAGSEVAPRAAAPPLFPVAIQRRRARRPPSFPSHEQDPPANAPPLFPSLEQGRPAQRRRPSSKGPRTRPRSGPQRQSDPRSRPQPRATRPEPAQRPRAPRLPGREPREAQRIRRRALGVGARSGSSPARPAPISGAAEAVSTPTIRGPRTPWPVTGRLLGSANRWTELAGPDQVLFGDSAFGLAPVPPPPADGAGSPGCQSRKIIRTSI